jgi:phospholipase C
MLTKKDPITNRSPRDDINSLVTSWLLGGVADAEGDVDGNNIVIDSITVDESNITISYAGPRKVFAPATPANWGSLQPGNLANIDHIVVLMMENRSFDHMLGYLSLPVAKGGAGRTDVDGLKGDETNIYLDGKYQSFPLTDTLFAPDPPHGYEPVAHAIDGGRMDGFVSSFGNAHGRDQAGKIMGHHTAATVPVYDALARDFAIGHRWFASHPGSTFPNRFYMLTGRPNLDADGFWEFDNSSPMRPVFTPTIFDYLSEAAQPVSWAYFEHGYCSLRFFERHTFDDTNIFSADDPVNGFYARAAAGTLPSVSFIDPHFIEYPPNGNCDGAPSDVAAGQEFVRKIVEAVVTSPAWSKTMLLIVYDEHGGFYDHVPPPAAPGVSAEFPIKTLGVRVPAFVISPWVQAGAVFGYDSPVVRPGGATEVVAHAGPAATADLHFDHTTILQTIARRFMSTKPPYMGARYAAAKDLSVVLGSRPRQPQFLPFVRHNLQFAASQMLLTVENGNAAARTPLWQLAADGSSAQDFAFEDAGNGFVYIRSTVGNLYVTVDGAHTPQLTPRAAAAVPGRAAAAGPGAGTPGLIQDVKYAAPRAGAGAVAGAPNPALQKWKLTPVDAAPEHRGLFLISSQAFPGKVLQPARPAQAQSALVLGDPTPNAAWKVSVRAG